jgi:two-component system chemotaxis sensor kinase CheA
MENICVEDMETIHEFLIESDENLSRLDQDLVELEKHPHDALLLGSIFRTIHTIKGACGFLAFSTLEGITHQAESILSQLRDGERQLTPALVSLVLETVDATRLRRAGKKAPFVSKLWWNAYAPLRKT